MSQEAQYPTTDGYVTEDLHVYESRISCVLVLELSTLVVVFKVSPFVHLRSPYPNYQSVAPRLVTVSRRVPQSALRSARSQR